VDPTSPFRLDTASGGFTPTPRPGRVSPWTKGGPSVAIYRFSAKVIGRSSGRSATAAAAYRAGAVVRDERTGQEHDYTRRQGVTHSEIIAPDNAPEWMKDRAQLWNAVEAAERRKDAQLSREIQLALPHQLDDAQRLDLVREFVKSEFVARGMVADVSIHAADAKGDDRNHHAHVMLTMRSLTEAGFGNKAREWNDEKLLEQWREKWEQAVNRDLARAGHADRVDHRSYADRGIDREPEPKQGPVATEMEREGRPSHAGDDRRAVQDRNAERARLEDERKVIDLEAERLRRDAGLSRDQLRAIQAQELLRMEQERKQGEDQRRRELEERQRQRDERARHRLSQAQGWRRRTEESGQAKQEATEKEKLASRQTVRLAAEQRHDEQEHKARTTGLRGIVNRVRDWFDPEGARQRERELQKQEQARDVSRFDRDQAERRDLQRQQQERSETNRLERLRREAEERARLEAELRVRAAREERARQEQERRRFEAMLRQVRGRGDDFDRGR
jgi:ATP-dependent exoDNAse (exonuclease V) alpha subunit